jgi:hypothetical protein
VVDNEHNASARLLALRSPLSTTLWYGTEFALGVEPILEIMAWRASTRLEQLVRALRDILRRGCLPFTCFYVLLIWHLFAPFGFRTNGILVCFQKQRRRFGSDGGAGNETDESMAQVLTIRRVGIGHRACVSEIVCQQAYGEIV